MRSNTLSRRWSRILTRAETQRDAALGRHAKQPGDIPWQGWRQVIRRTYLEIISDRISLVAAGCAFYATLALFPEAARYTEGPRPTRVTVVAGEPLPLEVVAYPAGGEGVVAESPSREGASAYEGAEIAPEGKNGGAVFGKSTRKPSSENTIRLRA